MVCNEQLLLRGNQLSLLSLLEGGRLLDINGFLFRKYPVMVKVACEMFLNLIAAQMEDYIAVPYSPCFFPSFMDF